MRVAVCVLGLMFGCANAMGNGDSSRITWSGVADDTNLEEVRVDCREDYWVSYVKTGLDTSGLEIIFDSRQHYMAQTGVSPHQSGSQRRIFEIVVQIAQDPDEQERLRLRGTPYTSKTCDQTPDIDLIARGSEWEWLDCAYVMGEPDLRVECLDYKPLLRRSQSAAGRN